MGKATSRPEAEPGVPKVKAVVVGDYGVGKFCFLFSWVHDKFIGDYRPTYLANDGSDFDRDFVVDEKPVHVSFRRPYAGDDYDRLRPLSYPETNVFLICFAVNSPTSFQNVREKWYPEVKHYCPDIPLLLMGTKSDLREADQSGQTSSEGRGYVTPDEAMEMAKEIGGAVGYYESSALTQAGVKEAMMAAFRVGLSGQQGTGGARRLFRRPWKKSRHAGADSS